MKPIDGDDVVGRAQLGEKLDGTKAEKLDSPAGAAETRLRSVLRWLGQWARLHLLKELVEKGWEALRAGPPEDCADDWSLDVLEVLLMG